MTRTLPLDPETWDIVLDKSGNWTARSDEAFVTAQSAANACMMFTDDAYFFPDEGIPYKWDILGQRSAQPLLEEYLKREVLAVPQIVRCRVSELVMNERTVKGTITIWTENGGTYDVGF